MCLEDKYDCIYRNLEHYKEDDAYCEYARCVCVNNDGYAPWRCEKITPLEAMPCPECLKKFEGKGEAVKLAMAGDGKIFCPRCHTYYDYPDNIREEYEIILANDAYEIYDYLTVENAKQPVEPVDWTNPETAEKANALAARIKLATSALTQGRIQ